MIKNREKIHTRSSKVYLKHLNTAKKQSIHEFIEEYRRVSSVFIDLLWDLPNVPTLIDKTITSKVQSWLSARALQAAGKQASGLVRGTRKKHEKRLFVLEKLKKLGDTKGVSRLAKIIKNNPISKPDASKTNPKLDSRFVKIDFNSGLKKFDGLVRLKSLGLLNPIVLPFKRHKHFNSLFKKGSIVQYIQISKNRIDFSFDIQNPTPRQSGSVVGLDIGINSTFVLSDGQAVDYDHHGHSLHTICSKLAKKQKGSKGFQRTSRHRDNYLNWAVKQLNLDGVRVVRREKLKYYKSRSRFTSHFNHGEIFRKVGDLFSKLGVQEEKIKPTYTSQRCSCCGWVRKGNRKGQIFGCDKCGFTANADHNAALNISLDLPPILEVERLRRANRKGFYWLVKGQEPIVPAAQKPFYGNYDKCICSDEAEHQDQELEN